MGNIESIVVTEDYIDMCDIEVEEVHCYYANGVVTHNCAQELRITANMSHEPVWESAFSEGRDVHRSTAEAVWGAENYNKDMRKRAKGVNFCECEGNLVLNAEKGYIPAESVEISDSLLGFNSNTEVVGVEKLDNMPCIEFVFSNGIKASYHEMHKLRCWDGSELVWVRAKDIDDSVQVIHFRDKCVLSGYKEDIINLNSYVDNTTHRKKYTDCIDKNSQGIAYLMGLYVGDGNVGWNDNHTKIKYLNQCVSTETAEKVVNIIKESGIDHNSIKCSIISNGNVALISYGGVGIARWVADNFGTPRNKKIPNWVFTDWSRESMLAFIAGYIDSDGSMNGDGKCSNICSTIPDLLHKTALMCSLLGLRTSFSSGESAIYKNGIKITEGKNGKFKDWNILSIYDLNTSGIKVLNKYKVWNESSKKWNYTWLSGSKEDRYKNFINPIRESADYKVRKNNKVDNFIGNLRDGHTGPTEFNLREVEKFTDKCPLKSTWYPVKVYKKREFTGSIVAIECDTHEYISMGMNSHNSVVYGAQAASFNDPFYGIHSLAEAEEFYENYKSKLPTLFQWIDRKQRQGRKNGTTYTYFGRPRRVKGYFDNGNFAFANRTITNTQIQGCHVYDNKVLTNFGYIKIGKLYDEFQSIHQDMSKWKYKVWNGMKWCDFFPVERGRDVKYKLHFDSGQIIECDSRHKVKVFGKDSIYWKDVKSLVCSNDKVCFMKEELFNSEVELNIEDYNYHIIERVENTGEEVDTYTLCVLDDSHQYVCEGMISHNTASDILKLVICRLWKKLLNTPEYHDDVRFLMTIHDEIQFGVRASRLNEITGIIEDCMLVHLPEWKVDIITEASFGFSSGGLFAWERVKDNTERGFTYRPKLD